MPYHKYQRIEIISLLLLILVPFFTEDCSGWLKETEHAQDLILPGGLDTSNNAAKQDFVTAWKGKLVYENVPVTLQGSESAE